MRPAASFWSERRVLVTGHTGFKSAWLTLWLRRPGADVQGYALTPPDHPALASLLDPADLTGLADVRSPDVLLERLQAFQPDVVFHLAAQALVLDSYAAPAETFDINVMGTVRVLEAVRAAASVRAVVNVTSDKAYENIGKAEGYDEHDALGGADPYSASKACAEIVTSAYRRSFFAGKEAAGIATARSGNVIGGGDWAANRLAPDAIRAFAEGRVLSIRNVAATRPWQHVLDALAGYLRLAQALTDDPRGFSEAWNFAPTPGGAWPVSRIADRFAEAWGDGAAWRAAPVDQPHEAAVLALSPGKSAARLGWSARLGPGEAVDWTVAWWKAALAGASPRAVSLDQIERFESLPESAG